MITDRQKPRTVIRNGIVMQEPAESYRNYARGGLLFEDKKERSEYFNPLRPLLYNRKPVNRYDYGGIYVVFPQYKVDTGLGFRMPLGHGMAIAVDSKTGRTRGSEYGRYDPENNGIAKRVTVPDFVAKDLSKPTEEELNLYAEQLDKMYGHSGGKTEVYYIPDANENEMISLMESAERNEPDSFYQNRNYNIFDHNCGTYAADMIKKASPWNKNYGFDFYTHGTPSNVAPLFAPSGSYTQK